MSAEPLTATPSERGASIMVSYQKLLQIETQMANIGAMLQAALALQGKVDGLDYRVQKIELVLAGRTGAQGVWNSILLFLGGVATAAIGAGALSFLPRLWGG